VLVRWLPAELPARTRAIEPAGSAEGAPRRRDRAHRYGWTVQHL